MAVEKRKCETVIQGEEGAEEEETQALTPKRRRVEFQDVTVYNFKRRQGYVCVPSQVRQNLNTLSRFIAFDKCFQFRDFGSR